MKAFSIAIALCGLFSASQAIGAPLACVEGTLSSYLGTECSMGGEFIAKNFYFEARDLNLSDPSVLATPDDIWVTPLGVGKGFGFSSTRFDIKGFQHVAYALNYYIDPPPPIIPGFEFFMDSFSPVAPGTAHITTDICAGGTFARAFNMDLILSGGPLDENGCESSLTSDAVFRLQVFDLGSVGKSLVDRVFFEKTNMVDIRTVIEMKANGASSQFNGFGTRAMIAPEPGSFVLGAVGLLALGLLRRTRR